MGVSWGVRIRVFVLLIPVAILAEEGILILGIKLAQATSLAATV